MCKLFASSASAGFSGNITFTYYKVVKFCTNFVITKNKNNMDISIIPIGNSKGIRLPKTLLQKYNITDKIELILEKGYIILKPHSAPRLGWEESFKQMHKNGDDKLLMNDFFEDENLEEW